MNRKTLSAVLLLSGMLFVGCGRDQEGISRITSPTVSRSGSVPRLDLLDDLNYEVFSGTLYPGESGIMSGTMTTWPKNCLFSLVVPASSMPPDGSPIHFTMSIPTKQSYLDHPELLHWMIIRLAPDGQQFQGPITVQGTWMPWQGVPPESLWVYSPGHTDSTLATTTYVSGLNPRYRVTYQVNHFSDWETGPGPRNEAP